MAFGKSSRTDGRRASSSCCSTAAIVVFVALCLVGVWVVTSTTVVPFEFYPSDAKSDRQAQVSKIDSLQPAEDSAEELVDDLANKGEGTGVSDNNTISNVNGDKGDATTEGGETEAGDPEDNVQKYGEKKSEENSIEPRNDGQQHSHDDEKSAAVESFEDDTAYDEKNRGQTQKVEKIDVRDPGTKSIEMFRDGVQVGLLNETITQNGAWSTQDSESKNEKELQSASSSGSQSSHVWKLCNVTAGSDYIPCLDNEQAIKKLRSTKHYEHRERHCPEEPPTCLVPLPDGYRRPIEWPKSRDKIWYYNVPHTKLVAFKGHQNWLQVSGEYVTFPGGGTQFKHGALHYIDVIQQSLTDIAWAKRSRVVLDVGCGVASFGGYLFDRDVLTMSFAPKDEHEAQVQFALERGIPAISAVMGTKRLPFPSKVFDVVHCARCRVPWHIEGGKLLLELNRLLRPGGYFVWSATPVYQKLPEDVEIWSAMSVLTKSMCWKMVTRTKDKINRVGLAIFRKPTDNKCYEKRTEVIPPLCPQSDDPDAAWNIPLQTCMHKLPVDPATRGSQWPELWPQRLEKTPYWLNGSQVGVYGRPASEDYQADHEHWKRVVRHSYVQGLGIDWSKVRNVMDMKAVYGGFAAALRDLKVWVMNTVPIDSADTLPIIYERGLFGTYHDWCESFSTYPRTYDLLHADHLFSKIKKRCNILLLITEVDRILRPEGKIIVRDNVETISELEILSKSLHWEILMTYSKDNEGLLYVQKTAWRPTEYEASM